MNSAILVYALRLQLSFVLNCVITISNLVFYLLQFTVHKRFHSLDKDMVFASYYMNMVVLSLQVTNDCWYNINIWWICCAHIAAWKAHMLFTLICVYMGNAKIYQSQKYNPIEHADTHKEKEKVHAATFK